MESVLLTIRTCSLFPLRKLREHSAGKRILIKRKSRSTATYSMPHISESSPTEPYWYRSMNCNARARPLPGAMTDCRRWWRVTTKTSRFSSLINASRWIWRTSIYAPIRERDSCSTVPSAAGAKERRRLRESSRLGQSNRRCIAPGSITTPRCRGVSRCTRIFLFTDSGRSRDIPPRTVVFACP